MVLSPFLSIVVIDKFGVGKYTLTTMLNAAIKREVKDLVFNYANGQCMCSKIAHHLEEGKCSNSIERGTCHFLTSDYESPSLGNTVAICQECYEICYGKKKKRR